MRPLSFIVAFVAAGWMLSAPITARAQTPAGLSGTWVWTVEGRPVLVLEVANQPGQEATLTRPGSISMTPDGGVNGVSGPVQRQRLTSSAEGDTLRLTYEDPADPAAERQYQARLIDEGRLEFRFDGGPAMRPLVLYRPHAPTDVLTDWGGDRVYGGPPAEGQASNPELRALFEADQTDRSAGPGEVDWSTVAERDRERQAATRNLLEAGAVNTADDFWRAAFIFQHGDSADDHLLAHALAVTAVAKGKADATWIAAAALDRYLQSIGRPQIYGTQFIIPKSGDLVTQGDYDRTLIPDTARQAAGVPGLAEQEQQRQAYEDRRSPPG
jgi:hypothetical protein